MPSDTRENEGEYGRSANWFGIGKRHELLRVGCYFDYRNILFRGDALMFHISRGSRTITLRWVIQEILAATQLLRAAPRAMATGITTMRPAIIVVTILDGLDALMLILIQNKCSLALRRVFCKILAAT